MTSTLLPPPLAGTCSWPSSKGGPFPQHGPSSCILHPEPHPLDSSTLQGTGARLHVPWSLCSCPHSTLPCSHPVRVPWALTKFSSVTGGPESPPHSHPPSPRASLLFPLSHAHPLPLNPRPSPHLLCSAHLLGLHLSLVPRPQWALTISILYPKSLFMPLGQQAFPTGSLLPGSPHAYWLSDPNPLWRCDLTPSNPSHHVGASQCAPWLSVLSSLATPTF